MKLGNISKRILHTIKGNFAQRLEHKFLLLLLLFFLSKVFKTSIRLPLNFIRFQIYITEFYQILNLHNKIQTLTTLSNLLSRKLQSFPTQVFF